MKSLQKVLYRSSRPQVFLVKNVLKICSKLTGKHPCWRVISIMDTPWHGCPPIFRTPFTKNTIGWLLLNLELSYICSLKTWPRQTKGQKQPPEVFCKKRCSFLEISQNPQENTCARVSFVIKLQGRACNFVKKETREQSEAEYWIEEKYWILNRRKYWIKNLFCSRKFLMCY